MDELETRRKMKMGRRKSKVELSPWTDHYIDLRRNGLSLPELEKEARKLGEQISHQSFYRYFKYKNRIDINQRIKERLDIMKQSGINALRENEESIVVLDEVKRNLRTLQALTSALIQDNPTNYQNINACTNLLKESRQTLQYLDKKRKDMMLETEQSEEMGIATLLSLLAEIPSKCPTCKSELGIVEKIQKKLEK